MNLKDYYHSQVTLLSAAIVQLKKRNRFFIVSELLAFSLVVVFLAIYALRGLPIWAIISAVGSFVGYLLIRRFDYRNTRETDSKERLYDVYVKELRYLNGDYAAFPDGACYVDTNHPFTFDMDVFGKDSLYQRMCRCVTMGGCHMLAQWLQQPLESKEAIDQRAEAIDELTEQEPWRAQWMSNKVPDSGKVHDVLFAADEIHEPSSFFQSRAVVVVSVLILLLFYGFIVLSVFTSFPSNIPLLWAFLELFVVMRITSRPLKRMRKQTESILKNMKGFFPLIRLLKEKSFKTAEVNSCKAALFQDEFDALEAFRELKRLLDQYDRRGNILGMMLMNIFMLSDVFLVRHYQLWMSHYAPHLKLWLDAIHHVDALVSVATFRYNEPQSGRAEVVNDDLVVYEARGIYHPFLGAKAVKNDFVLEDSHYYIITGANMAGKSTFLRTLGINYILATNGMPVFADNLRVSLFRLFTSMRTSDDLQHGISYFNAELLRLQQLIETCKTNDSHPYRTLIILDEILKGTNSLDKLNGSRMFLEAISHLPVTGVIATHDLELSKMESNRFHNYCFEIALGEQVTYSYKITSGVACNQNATFLLRNIIEKI